MRRRESPPKVRIVGVLLATIWLGGGVAALIAGVISRQWLLTLAGLMAVWYGIVWAFVARQGRRLTVGESLAPWRLLRKSEPDTSRKNHQSC